jgi:hypothetical protein
MARQCRSTGSKGRNLPKVPGRLASEESGRTGAVAPTTPEAQQPSLYNSFDSAYKGIKGTVRQASAKRTLRKIPKSKQE